MAAIATPVDINELLPRLKQLLTVVAAAYDADPTAEHRAILTQVEDIIEDLLDLQESVEALREAQETGMEGTSSWEEIKTEKPNAKMPTNG